MNIRNPRTHRAIFGLVVTLVLLIAIYFPTLLTQINGGNDPYMDDVGEIQVALNVWGTVHMTGYPLFTMLGNLSVSILRSLGVTPATAPALYSMAWGLLALVVFYALVLHLTRRIEITVVATLLLGLARSIWVHNVIAEVYSMSFAIQVILLAIALWRPFAIGQPARDRIWLLALIGGIGVAHHRLIVFMAPGLLVAVWPALRAEGNRLWKTLAVALIVGLLGFLPYLYLPARAVAHADWVYGDPSTLQGIWHEFSGAEAEYLMRLPVDANAWINDFVGTFRLLATELTPPIAIAGGIALLWAMIRSRFKHQARIAFICILGYFLFLFAFRRVVMAQAVAMPIVMVLVLAIALAFYRIMTLLKLALRINSRQILRSRWRYLPVGIFAAIILIWLRSAQFSFIYQLTHNDTGLQMIDLAKHVPREGGSAILMLPWGPRYHAVAFSKLVTKENADLPLVDHKANFKMLSTQGNTLYTSRDTFYQFPLSWWDSQIGRAYLSSAADGLVAIRREPLTQSLGQPQAVVGHGVVMRNVSLCTDVDSIHLTVTWGAEQTPDLDMSVFVHLLDGETFLRDAGTNAPVYGWYPTSRWTSGEVVYDNYVLPRLAQATSVSIGMYTHPTPNEFQNYGKVALPLAQAFSCN
jgi:hypothetical protein